MRIGREESLWPAVAVGEVAAPTARNQDLLADFLGVIEQKHLAAALARAQGAHQTRGTSAQDDDVDAHPKRCFQSGSALAYGNALAS